MLLIMRAILKYFLRFVVGLIALLIVLLLIFRGMAWMRETETSHDSHPDVGRLISTETGLVYIEEQGPARGIPLLLIHGSVGWAGFWRETSQSLAEAGYRAIAMDLSPMGYSDRDQKGEYSRLRQAERIESVVSTLDIKPILVAHSFGAGPAMEALLRQPDVFAGAVIIAGAIGLGSHEKSSDLPLLLQPDWVRQLAVSATVTNPLALKPLLQAFLHQKDRALPVYLDILKRPNHRQGTTAAIADWLPTLLVPPTSAKSTRPKSYQSLDLPVALIWGAEDTATPPSQGEELQRLIAGSTLDILPGLGHIPQIEDPPTFQRALLTAVSGLVSLTTGN